MREFVEWDMMPHGGRARNHAANGLPADPGSKDNRCSAQRNRREREVLPKHSPTRRKTMRDVAQPIGEGLPNRFVEPRENVTPAQQIIDP